MNFERRQSVMVGSLAVSRQQHHNLKSESSWKCPEIMDGIALRTQNSWNVRFFTIVKELPCPTVRAMPWTQPRDVSQSIWHAQRNYRCPEFWPLEISTSFAWLL
jgi:hypothetical protein